MLQTEKLFAYIEQRKKLHINDPAVETYWEKLADILGQNEDDTIDFLDSCDEETVGWISEVFEDVSERLNSSRYIKCLERLDVKFPNLKLESFIDNAKLYLKNNFN